MLPQSCGEEVSKILGFINVVRLGNGVENGNDQKQLTKSNEHTGTTS